MSLEGWYLCRSEIFHVAHDNRVLLVCLLVDNCAEYVLIPVFARSELPGKIMAAPVGSWIKIVGVKKMSMFKKTADEQEVWQTTKRSYIQVEDNDPAGFQCDYATFSENEADCRLYTYRGVVTSVKYQESGLYIVDKRIYVFLGPLAVLKHSAQLFLGDCITVYNCHLTTFRNKRCLVLCGRGSLSREDGGLTTGTLKSSASPFLSLVGEHTFALKDFLQLYENYEKLVDSFGDPLTVSQLFAHSCSLLQGLERRSMSKEFVKHSKACKLAQPVSCARVLPLHTLTDIRDYIGNNISNDAQHVEIAYVSTDESFPVLYGRLTSSSSGQLMLEDSSGSFPVLLSQTGQWRQGLVAVRDVSIGLEKRNSARHHAIASCCHLLLLHSCQLLGPVSDTSAPSFNSVSYRILAKTPAVGGSFFVRVMPPEMCSSGDDDDDDNVVLTVRLTDVTLSGWIRPWQTALLVTTADFEPSSPAAYFEPDTRGGELLRRISRPPHSGQPETVLRLKKDVEWRIGDVKGREEEEEYWERLSEETVVGMPEEEDINISGVIVDRWQEESNEKSLTWIEEICLSLANSSKARNSDINSRNNGMNSYRLYLAYPKEAGPPVGLLPSKNRFRISAVRKVTSRQGIPYFRATIWTQFALCGREEEEEQAEEDDVDRIGLSPADGGQLAFLEDHCTGPPITLDCILALEDILRIHISAVCEACASPVHNFRCSYVGCNAASATCFAFKGLFAVSDGTAGVLMSANSEETLQLILNLGAENMESMKQTALRFGEFFYSKRMRAEDQDACGLDLKLALSTAGLFCARLRRYIKEGEHRFHCLAVTRPSLPQINQCFLNSLHRLEQG